MRRDVEESSGSRSKAKHKIELHFGSDRTTMEAKGAFTFWEYGGGWDDIQMVICGYDRRYHKPCGKPFPIGNVQEMWAVCPHCQQRQWSSRMDKKRCLPMAQNGDEKLPACDSMRMFTPKSMDWIAGQIAKYFEALRGDANIVLKYHPKDIRYTTMVRDKGPDVARQLRGMLVYPLYRILDDTKAGADLVGRFKALLRA